MRVVVTGGRNYTDQDYVWDTLSAIHAKTPITLLVTGACHLGGADLLAENWAKYMEVSYMGIPAKFRTGTKGKAEGMIRNGRMLDTAWPSLVVAFPGGNGTDGCVKEAKKRHLEVEDHRNAV